ncbi:hypothetical protein HanXRQr2_Chr04g0154491 [Helianthus annuus]|uniref:Uncharacterized protein n=1 Tax=Helianthus annuus TaxID=4232 RepID=A0A251UX39_HELAN|nr:hypothetical protein HanXRQr2_Chr04g0154491 [Helianthus annuus]KAJ0587722.1 hypothetical protein HanIR_Chr04g0166431 [Helianthus annuus]
MGIVAEGMRFGVYYWFSLLGGLHCRFSMQPVFSFGCHLSCLFSIRDLVRKLMTGSHKQNRGILVSPIQLLPHLLMSPFRRHLNRGIKHLNEPLSCDLSV